MGTARLHPHNRHEVSHHAGSTAQCGQHGIGLIRIHDPEVDESFETILDPVRKATPPAAVDGFLEQRLEEDEVQILRSALESSEP